ncbi:glycosyltransferase family 2 protein [Christiangramia sp. OXR-203]|uniref:glycosyltransferase family 2 protein n=1 Tax=Christiangramia sp. OXR-203 TaxID=3100176 RepID=UPI002AC9D77D|nr:glycosyltransferase family 2 protein [Christiangramia sp. OXR-203]WPY98251.1 glycosyltransferase family 2 protein [Christiangramia sp. OXR-203]
MGDSFMSAIILTYNEENILAKCLSALNFVDEIIVFDSFSTDKTLDIARDFGATVIQRKFDNYANQRNAALKEISPKSDWVLMVDADEIVPQELKTEILSTISESNPAFLYRVRRKDMFQGKWIKQSSGYPTWFPRLFKNGEVRVEREINEEYFTEGKEGKLMEHLIHFPFNKGLSWWFDKHNRYSLMEAEKLKEELNEEVEIRDLLSKDPVLRRKTQKRLIYKLPFKPWIVFIGLYVFRGGFLNGKAGYTFCKLRKTYEWMIDLKLKELSENYSK